MNPAVFLQVAGLLPEPLLMISQDGTILAANAPSRRLTDRNSESLAGVPLFDLVADAPAKVRGFLKRCASSKALLPGSLTWNRQQGEGVRCRCDGALLEPPAMNLGALLLIRARMSEERTNEFTALNEQILWLTKENVARKEAQHVLTQRKIQLEAAMRELESFSYTVAHDLRSPLRAIDGFSSILLQEHASDLPQNVRTLLDDVRRNTLKMGHLIDDLLAFAQSGRQALNKQTVHPESLVRACLEELSDAQRDRRVEVVIGNLPPCEADPVFLKQVWINLLANALKYSRKADPARIEVGCEMLNDATGRRAYFVRDNGVGFDMRYAGKLFGVFQRLHRQSEYEGTGAGLAISQRIIHRHGGEIWAQAEPNKGATFSFTLEGGSIHD